MASVDEYPIRGFATRKTFETWLSAHGDGKGLWLKIAKKGTGVRSITYQEALETALCYGWIDSQKRGFDDTYFLQRFGPRGPRSIWSRINRSKAEQLIRDGLMKPSGLTAVERAKKNGEWERAYHSQKTMTPSDDLLEALEANPAAEAFFESLDGQNRYAVLFRVQTARTAEARANRIQRLVEMLERKERIHPA
jgi:uncharacterized protein YdeI (YjbR/CyaY-like superfamily)